MPCHDAATPRSPTHPGRAQLGAVPPAGTSAALLLVLSALCFPHGSAKPGLGPCRSEPPAGSGRLRAVPRSLRGPSQHRPPLGTGPLLTHSWRSCGRARIPACTSLGSSFSPGCLHLALPVTTAASRRSQPHAEPTPAPHRWADPPRSHQLSLTTPSKAHLLQPLPSLLISPPSPSPRSQPHPAHLRDTRALLLSPAPSSPSFPRLWGPALLPAPPSQALRAPVAQRTPFSFSFGVSLTAPCCAGSSLWRGTHRHAPLHVPKQLPATCPPQTCPAVPPRAGQPNHSFPVTQARGGRMRGVLCPIPSLLCLHRPRPGGETQPQHAPFAPQPLSDASSARLPPPQP